MKVVLHHIYFTYFDLFKIGELNVLWSKRVSSLVTCRGRRRVGKSTLIRRFAEKSHARFIKIEGERPDGGTTAETELMAFSEQLAVQTGSERTVPAGWLDAFIRLSREIRDKESVLRRTGREAHEGQGRPEDRRRPRREEFGFVILFRCVRRAGRRASSCPSWT